MEVLRDYDKNNPARLNGVNNLVSSGLNDFRCSAVQVSFHPVSFTLFFTTFYIHLKKEKLNQCGAIKYFSNKSVCETVFIVFRPRQTTRPSPSCTSLGLCLVIRWPNKNYRNGNPVVLYRLTFAPSPGETAAVLVHSCLGQ